MSRDKNRAHQEASDAIIRLPPQLAVGNDDTSVIRDDQYDSSHQRARPRVVRATLKNVQASHGSHSLSCAISPTLSNRRLIEGICKALEALLRATTCKKTNDNGGCRSLFSICLRQIPNYIAEEQRLTDDEDPENDIDVASEVYPDLEAFGSASNGGWEPLREVVRSHGVTLVGEAIQEGLIEYPLSRYILSLCLELAAYDEAECVIESMITWVKSRRLPPKGFTKFRAGSPESVNKWHTSQRLHTTILTDDASQIVDALRFYVSQTGRRGFMFRQLVTMLEDGIFSVDCASSKAMIECWNGVIRSITQQDDDAQSAALLLQIAISKSYREGVSNAKAHPHIHHLRLRACKQSTVRTHLRSCKSSQISEKVVESKSVSLGDAVVRPHHKDNALQSTFSNILIVLSAINILRSSKSGLDSSHPDMLSMAILRDVALETRQALELAKSTSSVNRTCSVPTSQLSLPLLSAGLVSITAREVGTRISPNEVLDLATLASLPYSKESVRDAGSFLCEVARCCNETGLDDDFRFVQAVVQDLISIAISDIYDKPLRGYCNRIAHAAAFAFSEDTGQPKHLDWALEIERTVTRVVDDSPKVVVDKTPARAAIRNKSGYKWEDGICEWIAKTPALALHRPTILADVVQDSTYPEAPQVGLVQALPLTSEVSPCGTERRLLRTRCRNRAGGDSYVLNTNRGNPNASEKLLFIRIPPRPQKVPRLQYVLNKNVANDHDELSKPESAYDKPVALREISNPSLGIRSKSFSRKHHHDSIGSCDLDMRPRKRHHLDIETYCQDTEDELGLP